MRKTVFLRLFCLLSRRNRCEKIWKNLSTQAAYIKIYPNFFKFFQGYLQGQKSSKIFISKYLYIFRTRRAAIILRLFLNVYFNFKFSNNFIYWFDTFTFTLRHFYIYLMTIHQLDLANNHAVFKQFSKKIKETVKTYSRSYICLCRGCDISKRWQSGNVPKPRATGAEG